MDNVLDTRTILVGIQVVMTYYQGTWVAPVQLFEQPSHRLPLFLSAGVGGLTSDVQSTLVAYAYRVTVMVHAVGTHHIFGPAFLNFSVTTDDVVVADAEVKASLAVPRINLRSRRCLVRAHGTAMNHD